MEEEFHDAINEGNFRQFRELLPRVDPNIPDEDMITPLLAATHYGIGNGITKMATTLLLDPRVNPNIPDVLGMTPLHHAVENNNVRLTRALLSNPNTSTILVDENGRRPIDMIETRDIYRVFLQHEIPREARRMAYRSTMSRLPIHPMTREIERYLWRN